MLHYFEGTPHKYYARVIEVTSASELIFKLNSAQTINRFVNILGNVTIQLRSNITVLPLVKLRFYDGATIDLNGYYIN